MNEDSNKDPQPNVVINIGTAYNVNPAATKVENTFIIGAKEGKEAIAEVLGKEGSKMQDSSSNSDLKSGLSYLGEPEENTDCTPIRTEILNYVSVSLR